AATSASAWARVLIIGQIAPYTPASRIFMSSAGSFQGTRASGMTGVVEIAWSIVTAVWQSTTPCCMSTVSESNPWWAITSAENELGIDSHPFTTASPRAQIFLSVFSLTTLSLLGEGGSAYVSSGRHTT